MGIGEGSGWRALRRPVLALGFFTLYTLVVFHPLLPVLATRTVTWADSLQMVWNLWWVKHALVDLQTNPFVTDYLFHPEEVSLLFHTLVPAYGVASIPIQLAVEGYRGAVLSVNLFLLFTFVGSGWFAYLLARKVSGSELGACAGGVVHAFSVYHFASVSVLNLSSLQWIPLGIFALLSYLEGERSRTRHALGVGAVFTFQLFCGYFYALEMFLLCAGCFGWIWTTAAPAVRYTLVRRAFVVSAACLPAVLVFAVLAGQVWSAGRWPEPPAPEMVIKGSADLAGFILPAGDHPLYGSWFRTADRSYERSELSRRLSRPDGARGDKIFLTFSALLLLGLGLVRREKPPRYWMWFSFLVVLIWLSFGPVLHVLGRHAEGFPVLYALVDAIPIVNMNRVPHRFVSVVTLCLGVLVAMSIATLQKSLQGRAGVLRHGVGIALLAWIAIENFRVVEPKPLRVSAVARRLAADPEPYAVLIVHQPGFVNNERLMFEQVTHRKKIDTGFVSRPHPALAFPFGASYTDVLARLERVGRSGVYRYAIAPDLEGKIPSSRDRPGLERVHAWLEANATGREKVGRSILFRLPEPTRAK